MKKAIILYDENSKSIVDMAAKIADGFKDKDIYPEVTSYDTIKPEELVEYDVIVFGSPCYYGTMSNSLKKFLDSTISIHGQLEGKIGGAFSESANVGGGAETTVLDILKFFLIQGMVIQGDPLYSHFGPVISGEANFETNDICKRYGSRLATLLDRVN